MKRINVVGISGSGKSTFSRDLARAIGVRHIEMDAIYWQADWRGLDDDSFAEQLNRQLQEASWVLDGNYTRTIELKWSLADTVVWLDYSFGRTFLQVVLRSVRRALSSAEIWPGTGNTETLYRSFFSRDSVILWMLTNYHSNRKKYLGMMSSPRFSHINFIRIKRPSEAVEMIQKMQAEPN